MKLKGGGTHGGDHITGYVVKISGFFLADPIKCIINKSITEGIYPMIWKKQLTHPTHKKGNGEKLEDWRPVRHISEIGKNCESLIGDQIMEHYKKMTFSTLLSMGEYRDFLLFQPARKSRTG